MTSKSHYRTNFVRVKRSNVMIGSGLILLEPLFQQLDIHEMNRTSRGTQKTFERIVISSNKVLGLLQGIAVFCFFRKKHPGKGISQCLDQANIDLAGEFGVRG